MVGASSNYNCSGIDQIPDVKKAVMEHRRTFQGNRADIRNRKAQNQLGRRIKHIAVTWPMFMSHWHVPYQAWDTPMVDAGGSFPALRGGFNMNNVTFANFGDFCPGIYEANWLKQGYVSKVLRPTTNNDFQFPITTANLKFVNTSHSDKVFIDRDHAPVWPGDCVDFDCDGYKKLLLVDTDGTFLDTSSPGTLIPDSAVEWDGNPSRGLGYYRVPKPMITSDDGTKIPYQDIMPHTGIIRNSACSWNDTWVAYTCHGLNHRVMILESLDRDSLFRRLSPVALLANRGTDGYIDLINGPQDHTCCAGYTCSFRLSTFYTILATGQDYEIVLSSIPPQDIRLHILDNEDGESTRIKIWFPKQQRYDVYSGERFVFPNNYDFSSGKYNLVPPEDNHIPTMEENNGANFFDPRSGHLHIILRSPQVVTIRTQPVIILKMGMAVPEENFFEENIINNIAGLLGIDPANIRVTKIVREGSLTLRSAGGVITNVEFEIGPPPQPTFDESSVAVVTLAPSSAESTTTQDPLIQQPTTELPVRMSESVETRHGIPVHHGPSNGKST